LLRPASGRSARAAPAWGWRLPFGFGLLIGPVAYFIRMHASETTEFEKARAGVTKGVPSGTMPNWGNVALGAGAVVAATVALYSMLYLPTFTRSVLGLPSEVGFAATFAAGVTLILIPPIAGALSDRTGRLGIGLPAVVLIGLLPVPLFMWLVSEPSAYRVILTQLVLSTATAIYLGVLPAFLSELFPVQSRSTGLSLSYNISVVLAGGFAPMLFAVLVRVTGNQASPSFYLTFAAAVSLGSLLLAGRRPVH
jgi:MHS family proline/betaine transporter-like MFS transporter